MALAPANVVTVTSAIKARVSLGRATPPCKALTEVAHVVRRAEDPVERVVVALGRATLVDVVPDQALDSGGMENESQQPSRDLDAGSTHQARVLIFLEGRREVAVRLVGARAQANGVFDR